MRQRLVWFCLVALLAGQAQRALAEITPNNLFTDNAVLQRDIKVPVWGTTDKPEKVTVRFAGQEVSADPKDGQWQVELAPLAMNKQPATLTISQGDAKVERKNILVGDVWVCGGQSNMQWGLKQSAGFAQAVATSDNDQLRLITVPRHDAAKPETNVNANWVTASPETTPEFTAVGYYFGLDLQRSLGVPIGLINSNVGGTAAERWTPKEALEGNEDLKHMAGAGNSSSLWNAMMFPLTKFPIRGAIWYQGEANAGKAWQYRTLLPVMIRAWRAAWNQGDFPFLIVQLAPHKQIVKEPEESDWAELREAQTLTTRVVPNTAEAVITDLGDPGDIHPKQKREVGERLALAAKKISYGQNVLDSGPTYESHAVEGDKVVVKFKNVGKGMVAVAGPLAGFAVAGEDKKFHNATAAIDGDKVIVHSDQVPNPVAVRYAWANCPVVNLWNKDGLPACPFRTDVFPAITKDRK